MEGKPIEEFLGMKGLKLVHLNARSLYNKLVEIKESFHSCDIIIITETWLKKLVPSSAIGIEGYNVIRQDRHCHESKKGGGICIYLRTDIVYEILDECTAVNDDFEILGSKIKIGNIKPMYLLSIYRPPKGNIESFFKFLTNNIESFNLVRNEVVVMGDLNIDYSSAQTRRKHKIKQFETKFNLKQLIQLILELLRLLLLYWTGYIPHPLI